MKTVTIPDLIAGIEGVSEGSARKALRQLEVHGYVQKTGETRGGHNKYARSSRVALLPAFCERCGGDFSGKTCDPAIKEKEREREREKERTALTEQGRARVAEMVDRVNDIYEVPRLPAGPVEQRNIPAELKERLERQLNGTDEEVPDDAA